MILEALLEQKLADEFSSLDQLSGVQIVKSRSTDKTENDDTYSVVAIASGFRQHDNFSLSPITIPVAITIVTRVEGDANSSSHLEIVEAIADKLSYWHKHGDEMQEALTTSKCVANELKMDGGSNSVYDNTQDIWTDTINITIRGAEKFPVPPETRTVVTYKDGSVQKLELSGELVRHQIPNWSNAVSVEIGQDISSIANAALFQGDNLESIVVPDTVTSIGNNAFAYCTKLSSLTLGQNVESIGDRFIEYSALTSLSIPKSVTTISSYALTTGDSKFRDITFEDRTIAEVQAMPNYSWRLWRPQVIHCVDGDITF